MSSDTWIEHETSYQEKLSNLKICYEPCTTVTVTVRRGRNLSAGVFHDFFDTPDMKVYVRCDAATGTKVFATKVASNTTHPQWNESFTFILSKEFEEGTIQVDVYESDDFWPDPHVGNAGLKISTFPYGERKPVTMKMKKRGEVDIEILKQRRTTPDCRMSLGLSEEERRYRIHRKPKTMLAMQNLLERDGGGPQSLQEVPTVALAISGGGYRALAASCGAMEALAENGLVDALMYIAGLSGSSWYLSTVYQHESLGSVVNLIEHHDWIRERSGKSLYSFLLDPGFLLRYRDYRNFKLENGQETTLVDLFGFSLGETFLDKHCTNQTLSSLKSYVEAADVPFLIMSCAHVHEKLPMSVFWDEVELTPIEISLPGYGINIPTETFNSRWGNGILQQYLPEPPLHYMMGTSGSAFAILWSKIKAKTEVRVEILKYIESIYERHSSSEDEDLSDDGERDTIDPEKIATKPLSNFASKRKRRVGEKRAECRCDVTEDQQHDPDPIGRGIMIERTAKVHNCASSFPKLKKYLFNTNPVNKETATRRIRNKASTKKKTMSLCDSGIGCNIPAIHVMRPQRTVDVLIVVDCSPYEDNNHLDFQGFTTVKSNLCLHGIKFPNISIEKISEDPFREVYLFEDEDDKDCPVVIWFTLANGKFRTLSNPPRRSGYPTPDPVDDGEEKFNDFTITSDAREYSTTKLASSPLSFDRLRELMKFNVSENIPLVKEKLAGKVKHMTETN